MTTGEGARPKLLLLHGFLSCRAAWEPVRRALPADIASVAPDVPGYGEARAHAARDLDRMVDHLAGVVEREQPTHLVGHSMGGIVALALAAAHPGRFDAVGVIGLPVYRDRGEGIAYLSRRSPSYRLLLPHHSVAHAGCVAMHHFERAWRPFARLVVPWQPPEVLAGAFDHSRAGHEAGLDGIVFAGLVDGLAERCGVPVTLLHGSRDRAAPVAPARAVAERHGWPFELATGHGHQNILQRPRTVARWIAERVVRYDGTRPAAEAAPGQDERRATALR